MSDINLSQNRVEGGFFLHNGHKPAPYKWPVDDNNTYWFVGTYRNSGSPVRDSLIEMIRCAKRRIFIASFMIGDEEVISELINAAQRLKGSVYVITAVDKRSLRRGLDEYENQDQEPPEQRRKNFERLTTNGIYVRGHEFCHAKFAVVDDTIALVGSANFVKNSFERAGEADLVIKNPLQVQQCAKLFTELWYEGCLWEVPPGETYVVAERGQQKPPTRPSQPMGLPGEIVWTNGPEQTSLLRAIHKTIDSAADHLTLSTYSIVGMQDTPSLLLAPLKNAVDRGVRVKLFIRQRNAWPEQRGELLALHNMGVNIYGDILNHAKVALADRQTGVIFSANLDANYGLDKGVEIGVVLPNADVTMQVQHYVDHCIEEADVKFVHDPTLADLNGKLAARWCMMCPIPSVVNIGEDHSDWDAIRTMASCGPVLFEQESPGSWRLFGGSQSVLLCNSTKMFKLKEWREEEVSVYQRLCQWSKSVRGTCPDEMRGFCASRFSV